MVYSVKLFASSFSFYFVPLISFPLRRTDTLNFTITNSSTNTNTNTNTLHGILYKNKNKMRSRIFEPLFPKAKQIMLGLLGISNFAWWNSREYKTS